MPPPKKSATTTPVSAANFFQRGKKSTTVQRVIALKRPALTTEQKLKNSLKSDTTVTKCDQDPTRDTHASPNKTSNHPIEPAFVVAIEGVVSDNSLESLNSSKKQSGSDSIKHELSDRKVESILSSFKVIPLKRTLPELKMDPNDIKIHRQGISEAELILRQFDLKSAYGPCLNLTRLERWERAFELGLSPPQNVKDLILGYTLSNAPLFAGIV